MTYPVFEYDAPLPPRAQRNLWLRFEGQGYADEIIQDFEERLGTIFSRQVNRVHVLDFEGLTEGMRQALIDRLRMVDQEGHEEGVQADPAPIQAPQAPPVAAPGPRTKPQRMARLEEEVHGLRDSLGEQRAVLDEMSRDFSRYHTRDAPNEGQMGLAPQQPHTLTTSPIFNLSSLDTPILPI
ncbi:hypothetical protein Tco_0096750 [Tanacetum coccineum]